MVVESRLKAADLFSGLDPEKERELKQFKVKKTPALDAIVKGFRKVEQVVWTGFDNSYNTSELYLPENYTAKDIENFCVVLADYPDLDDIGDVIGMYLSALINNCSEKSIILPLQHLEISVWDLSYKNNGSHVTVRGDVGFYAGKGMKSGIIDIHGDTLDDLGSEMKGGKIYVRGNVRFYAGDSMKGGEIYVYGDAWQSPGSKMQNGIIHIYGNAGQFVGADMRGGNIYIHGNAGNSVGTGMNSGEIHLNGDYGSISTVIRGGNIYHKGKLIVKDGKLV